jgi:hypothetical protein
MLIYDEKTSNPNDFFLLNFRCQAEDVYFKLSGNLTPSSKIGYKKQIIVIVLIVNCVKLFELTVCKHHNISARKVFFFDTYESRDTLCALQVACAAYSKVFLLFSVSDTRISTKVSK